VTLIHNVSRCDRAGGPGRLYPRVQYLSTPFDSDKITTQKPFGFPVCKFSSDYWQGSGRATQKSNLQTVQGGQQLGRSF
jgi:hypothetical protein